MTSPPASRRGGHPRSFYFRRQRESDWTDLELMVDQALIHGLRRLSQEELQRLPALYRATLSSLMVARETAMDRELVKYLEALSARAYLVVYGNRRPSRSVFGRFVMETFPNAVRKMWAEVALSTLLFVLGMAVAIALVLSEPAWFYAFVDAGLAAGRNPGASTADLREVLYSGDQDGLTAFSSYLFTHNTRIGMLSFALGIAAGVPTAMLLFSNGLMLGAFVGPYAQRGLLLPLLGWLLPHGVPEIAALLLCGAAGLHIGRAIALPGGLEVREALKQCGRRAALVVAGTILLFAVAGVVEGVFRQVVLDDGIRFVLIVFNTLWLALWLLAAGRRPSEVSATREP
jgi:uncharacterized membrane protein SpoIIM required for sporulation